MGARKATLIMLLVLVLALVSFPQFELAKAQDNAIYIRADGTDLIQTTKPFSSRLLRYL